MRDYEFDLLLINLQLRDMDGSSLIRRICSAKHLTPVIALSAAPQPRLRALAAGADDVVERDLDRAELIARVRAIVRRSRGFSQSLLTFGDLTLNVDQHDVTAHGVRVHLTAKEFAILELLVLRRNMIMTKDAILSQLYGGMDEPEIKIIDVFICKIRYKLTKAGLPNIISTVWGRGYTVKDAGSDAPRTHLAHGLHRRKACLPSLAQPSCVAGLLQPLIVGVGKFIFRYTAGTPHAGDHLTQRRVSRYRMLLATKRGA